MRPQTLLGVLRLALLARNGPPACAQDVLCSLWLSPSQHSCYLRVCVFGLTPIFTNSYSYQ